MITRTPTRPPSHDELEALIEEAGQHARRRRLLCLAGAVVVAILAGTALGSYYLARGGDTSRQASTRNGPVPDSRSGVLVLWGSLWGRSSLYTVQADGKHFKRLLTMDDTNEIPGLSPDGSQLVFAQELRHRQQRRGLHYLDLRTGRVRDVPDTAHAVVPQWAPDARHIVYRICLRFRCTLWSMRPDGSDRHPISKGLNPRGPGTISPDGRWIAFISMAVPTPFSLGEPGRLYAVRLDGSERRLLSASAQYPVAWATDTLLFGTGSGIDSVSLSGEARSYSSSRDVQEMTSSPDGKWLAFTSRSRGAVRLSISRLDGSDLQPVYTSGPTSDFYPFVWSADSRELVFTQSERHSRTLLTVVSPSHMQDASQIRVFHVVRPLGWSSPALRSTLTAGPVFCRPTGHYRLVIDMNGATGAVVGMPGVVSRNGTACRLDTRLRFSIRRPDRSLVRGIRGNPAQVRLHGTLTPANPLGQDWAWRNWCGTRNRVVFVASTNGGNVARKLVSTNPRCDAPRAPSSLTFFGP